MKKPCDPLPSDEAPARTPNRRVARRAAGKVEAQSGTRGASGAGAGARVGVKAGPMLADEEEAEATSRTSPTTAMLMTVPLPAKTRAKVKLGLSQKSNAEVVAFARAHEQAIATNAHFPLPVPLPEVFQDKRVALEQAMHAYAQARLTLQAMAERRDRLRAEFDAVFTQRGAYVQCQSGGDAELIQEVALPVQNPPKKLGRLAVPVGLRVDLGAVPGQMQVRWEGVTKARGYVLQSCVAERDGERRWTLVKIGGRKAVLKDLLIGVTYAFRVAAVGGHGGRSAWSPEVTRVAA